MKQQNQIATQLVYIVYARKSTDSEDRQVQSLDDQLNRLRDIAKDRNLRVLRTYTESKSAKTPGSRVVFDEMIAAIEAGKANGILCWELNRLSRNPIESGRLSWLLQRGMLRSILTVEREFRPEDNVLLFSLETGMANQYVLDLSRNVKRGMLGKVERGEWPALAPIGYLNDRLTKKVIKDPLRFHAIQELWRLYLTGAYSVSQLHRRLTTEGITTRQKRAAGKPVSASCLYQLFRNPFYAGLVRQNGREFPGRHEAMISVTEFEKAQQLLPARNRPRPKKYFFTYSRLFRCGDCGGFITAENKRKFIKSTGDTKTYIYYHCTHRKRRIPCSDRACTTEESLTDHLCQLMRKYALPFGLCDWSLRALSRQHLDKQSDSIEADNGVRSEMAALKAQLERLTQMRYSDLITEEEFKSERLTLQQRSTRLEVSLEQSSDQKSQAERLEACFGRLVDLAAKFAEGTPDERRELVALIGSNRIIRKAKPLITVKNWLYPIERFQLAHEGAIEGIELEEKAGIPIEKGAFAPLLSEWWATIQEVRNLFLAEDNKPALDADSQEGVVPPVGLYPETRAA